MLNFKLKCQHFPKVSIHLTIKAEVQENFSCSTYVLTVGILDLLILYILVCVVVSDGLHLHFLNDEWCRTSFHVPNCHPYILSVKCLFKICTGHILHQVVFILLNHRSYLYFLGMCAMGHIFRPYTYGFSFLNIFFQGTQIFNFNKYLSDFFLLWIVLCVCVLYQRNLCLRKQQAQRPNVDRSLEHLRKSKVSAPRVDWGGEEQ